MHRDFLLGLRRDEGHWPTESSLAAREAYRVHGTGDRLKSGRKLSEAYLNANLTVVRRRLFQAGVRLAGVLNEAFPEPR
jgi:nuclease S1